MKNNRPWFVSYTVVALLLLGPTAWAQSAAPFDDLPDDEPLESAPQRPSPSVKKEAAKPLEVADEEADLDKLMSEDDALEDKPSKASTAKKSQTQVEPEDSLDADLDDESLEPEPVAKKDPLEMESDDKVDENLDGDLTPLPQTQVGQSVSEEPLPESDIDPTLSPVVSEKDFQSESSDDVKAVQQQFDREVVERQRNRNIVEPQDDPGAGLPPDERFARVPLRPRMSDASWKKWAGPGLTKVYKIRRKDSLWNVSDRLFGTPYLWPKVWHLNAQLTNPNIIEPGIELQFNPGNPNSAPSLALLSQGQDNTEPMPLLIQNKPLTLYERLEQFLVRQVVGKNPPFRNFLIYDRPKTRGKVPDPLEKGRLIWKQGDTFATRTEDGKYVAIRLKGGNQESIYGHRIQWVGNVSVNKGEAHIDRQFAEIEEGDLLIDRNFQIAPSSIHEDRLENLSKKVKLVQLEDEAISMVSQNTLVGVVFPSSQTGPTTGSLLNIEKNKKKVGTLLIIDRDRRMATGWVVDSTEEFDYTSSIQ